MRKLIFILIALVSFSQAQTIQYIGGPTTTVISKGNFRADSIFYLPKRTKTPTDTAAFRYQISDSSLYYWTGYQWTKVQSASSFASVDTNIISTRAWRQKGIDSVQYNVGLKVNISDTASMLSPYIVGSGTSNYFPKFNATRSVVNSKLYESNLNLLFNSSTPYFTTSGISSIENNGTSASVYLLKTLDTARAYVSFGGANTMDINNLRAGDIRFYTNATLRGRFQTDGTFRLNSLTGTGSRIVVADDNGVLSATSSATGLVDTTLLSTRAYRQKGDDSLGAIIATKGSGTVTSVATGYGLSGGTITTTGTLIADTALVTSRLRLGKVADSLSLVKQNVLTNPVTGTGTTNRMVKFTGTSTVGDGSILDQSSSLRATITSGGSLYFKGASSTTDAEFILENDNTASYFFGSTSGSVNKDLRFYFNGTASGERFRIFNNGRIFMGSTPTDNGYQVDINGTLRTNNNTFLATSAAEVYINTSTDAGAYTLQNNGALYNTLGAVLAASSGQVGIGITPSYKLDVLGFQRVSGNVYLSTAAGAFTRIGSVDDLNLGQFAVVGDGTAGLHLSAYNPSTTNGIRIGMFDNTNNAEIRSIPGTSLTFRTNGNERVRITSDGESLFGTTTDAGNYRVQVSGDILANVIYTRNNTDALILGTNASVNPYIQGLSSNGVVLGTSNTARLTVTSTGNIGIATISPSNQLDIYTTNRTSLTATGGGVNVNYNGNTTGEFSTIGFSWAQSIDGASRWGMGITGTSFASGTADLFFFTGGVRRMNIISDGRVAVNTTSPEASAQFEVASTARGFLPPRLTTTQRDAISSPAAGLVIYNTTTSKLQVYTTSWTDLH